MKSDGVSDKCILFIRLGICLSVDFVYLLTHVDITRCGIHFLLEISLKYALYSCVRHTLSQLEFLFLFRKTTSVETLMAQFIFPYTSAAPL